MAKSLFYLLLFSCLVIYRDAFTAATVVFRFRIHKLTPIEITAIESTDYGFGSGDIGGYGNIVYSAFTHEIAISEKRIEIRIYIIVAEVKKHIYFIVCYS